MNEPDSILQVQTESLLRRVAREQEILARRARDAAQEQARGIVARARDEARARQRQAAEEAHQALERTLADRRAALETAARQREQSLLREVTDAAWQELPAALAAVWDDDDARRRWCEAACALVRRVVTGEASFVVELDADAPEAVAELAAGCLRQDDARLEVRRIEGIGPGLRVRHGLACVDATITGLLASRERIEAELLTEFDALREDSRRAPA